MDPDEFPETRRGGDLLTQESIDQALPKLTDEIKRAAADSLDSVLLYGSAAGGGYKANRSNVNVLVVLRDNDVQAIRRLSPIVKSWDQKLYIVHVQTLQELKWSARVFPIHTSELKDHHKVLVGNDPMTDVSVVTTDLRDYAERELLQVARAMRRVVLMNSGDPRMLGNLIRRHFRQFVYGLRGLLRHIGKLPPTTDKHPTLEAAASEFGLDRDLLVALLNFRRRLEPVSPVRVDELAEGLLVVATKAADAARRLHGLFGHVSSCLDYSPCHLAAPLW